MSFVEPEPPTGGRPGQERTPKPAAEQLVPGVRLGGSHPFDASQIRKGATIIQSEHPIKRLFLAVSMGHREWSRRQTNAIQVFGIGLLMAIFLTEAYRPSIANGSLMLWAASAAAMFTVRSFLFYLTFRVTPEQMARSRLARAFPLLSAVFSFPLWGGTCWLFMSQGLTPTVLVIFAGFVVLSIPTAALWFSAPLAVVTWVLAGWGGFFYFALTERVLAWQVALLLFAAIVGAFYAVIVLQVRSIAALLDRSDQVDLLVESLEDANAQLRSSNAELDKLKQEAERVLAARSTFFATASHDLKQRLHAAKLLANVLADGPDASVPTPLRQLADTIDDVERLSGQALEFAQFERIFESVHTPHDRAAVPLQRLFQELAVSLDAAADLAKIDLRFRVTDAVILADRHLLSRIIENIIQNALRYSRERVLVASRRRGSGLVIQVWDRGPGIRAEVLPRIFEPFYRSADAQGTTGHRGYGLGLATVKRFAEVLGMTVSVRSRVGRGSVFELHVPAELVPDSSQR